MAEYIDKKRALDGIKSSWCMHCEASNGVLCDECEHNIDIVILDGIPSADVLPVKRGYWKATMMSESTGWDLSLTGGRDEVCEYNCSVCGQANILDEFGENFLPPYCPFCGAEMENPETIKG